MPQFPWGVPSITPDVADLLLLADVDNADFASKATVSEVVWEWLTGNDTDSLPQGSTNLYMTNAEKTKLSWITAWAEVNAVDSVNGFIWTVVLNQDNVWDWATYKQTENNFSNTKVSELSTAYAHVSNLANPHAVNATQVGLGNVTNDAQLKRSNGDFNTFPQKSSLHPTDIVLIEDSIDSFNKKKVEVQDLSSEVVQALGWLLGPSLEIVWSILQFVNDTLTPAEDSHYWYKDWVRWYHKNYDRTTYPATTNINIPTGYNLAIHWDLIWGGIVDWPGNLYIL